MRGRKKFVGFLLSLSLGMAALFISPAKAYAGVDTAALDDWAKKIVSMVSKNTLNELNAGGGTSSKSSKSNKVSAEYDEIIKEYTAKVLKKNSKDPVTADSRGSEYLQKKGIKTAVTVKGLKTHLYKMNTGGKSQADWWDVAGKGRQYIITLKKPNDRVCYVLRVGKDEDTGVPTTYSNIADTAPAGTTKYTSIANCFSQLKPNYAWRDDIAAKDCYTSKHLSSLHKFTNGNSTDEYVDNGSKRKHDRVSFYFAEDPALESVHGSNIEAIKPKAGTNVKELESLFNNTYVLPNIGSPYGHESFVALPYGTTGMLGGTKKYKYYSKFCVHIFTNGEGTYKNYADLYSIDGLYTLINHKIATDKEFTFKKVNGVVKIKTPGQTKWAEDVAEAFSKGAKNYFIGSDRVEASYTHYGINSKIEFYYNSASESCFYKNLTNTAAYDYVNGGTFSSALRHPETFNNNFGTVLPLFSGSNYALAIFKVDKAKDGKLLKGAEFTCSWTTADISSEKDYLNDKYWVIEKNIDGSKSQKTDKNGAVLFKGIANTIAGNNDNLLIRIQETKAPEGYIPITDDNKAQYTAVINAKTGDVVYGKENIITGKAKKTEMKDMNGIITGGVLYSVIFNNSANKGKITLKKAEWDKDGTTSKPLDNATFVVYPDKDGEPDTDTKLATVTTGKKEEGQNDSDIKHGQTTIDVQALDENKKPLTYWIKETVPPTGYTTAVTSGGSAYFKVQFTKKEDERKYAEYAKDGYDQSSVKKVSGKGKSKKESYTAEITIYDEKAQGVNIDFDKVDSQTRAKLKGAEFKLLRYVQRDLKTGAKLSSPILLNKKNETKQNVTGDVWKNAKSYYSIVTDENGHGKRNNLPAGMYSTQTHKWIPFIYKIKEVQTPYSGSYKLNDTVYVVTSDTSYHAGNKEQLKTFTYDKTKAEAVEISLGEIKDEPIKYYGNLKLIKVDAEGNEDGSDYYIEGAGFTLYADGTIVGSAKKTGADGVVEWTNLPLTKDDGTWIVYTYQETIKPEYTRKNDDGTPKTGDNGQKLEYQLDPTVYTITGDMWMTEKDKNPNSNPIRIEKKVVNSTNEPPKEPPKDHMPPTPDIQKYVITKNTIPYPFDTPENTPKHGNTKEVNPNTGDINSAPTAYTYNNNAIYDLGTAIPTTETFTNTFEGNTWYGSVEMNRHQLTNTITVNASTAGIIEKPLMAATLRKYGYKYNEQEEYYNHKAQEWMNNHADQIDGYTPTDEDGIGRIYLLRYKTGTIPSGYAPSGTDCGEETATGNTAYDGGPSACGHSASISGGQTVFADYGHLTPLRKIEEHQKSVSYSGTEYYNYDTDYNASGEAIGSSYHGSRTYSDSTSVSYWKADGEYLTDEYGNYIVSINGGNTCYVYSGPEYKNTLEPDNSNRFYWNKEQKLTPVSTSYGKSYNIAGKISENENGYGTGTGHEYQMYANSQAGDDAISGVLKWSKRGALAHAKVEQKGSDYKFTDGIIEDGKTKDDKTDFDKKSKYGNDVWDNVKFNESANTGHIEKVYDKTLSGTFSYNDGGSNEVGKQGSMLGGGKHRYDSLALEDGTKDNLHDRAISDMKDLSPNKRYNLRSYTLEYDTKTAQDAMLYKNYQQTIANKGGENAGGYETLPFYMTKIDWVSGGKAFNPPILKADDNSGYSKTSTAHWMYDFPYYFHLITGDSDFYKTLAANMGHSGALDRAYNGIFERYYYETANVTLKQLDNATVKNYSGPEVNYQNNIEIPYDIKTLKTGNRVTTGSMLNSGDFTTFDAAKAQMEPDKNHYIQDPVPKRVQQKKVGSQYGGDNRYTDFSKAAFGAMAQKFTNATQDKRVIPLSDTVILNGVKYCDEKMGVPSKSICGTASDGTVSGRDGYNVIDEGQESEDTFYIKGKNNGTDTDLFHKDIDRDTDIKGDSRIYPFTDVKNGVGAKLIGKQDNDWFSASKDITIPMETRNGRYGTDMTVNYKPIAFDSGNISFGFKANEGGEAIAHENEGIDGWNDKAIKPGGSTSVGDFSGGSDNYDIVSDSDPTTVAERAAGNRWKAHEPVVVHSPVVSPVHIGDPSKTQSLNVDSAITGQLLPDHEYTMNFDWDRIYDGAGYHRMAKQYAGYDFPKGYLKFVKRKQIRFPFDVRIQGIDDSKPEYYQVGSDGYTKWITLSADNWTSFKFYVPTWADTGVYDATASEDLTGSPTYHARSIQSRVWANNSLLKLLDGQIGKRNGNNQENETDLPFSLDQIVSEEYNTDRQYYVTTFNYPVQVNSIMYGFTVLGINDEDSYNKSGLDKWENDDWHQLAKYKQEKSTGKYNRVGGTAKRYEQGEEVTNEWPDSQTLPFSQGKSDYALNGLMSCGQIFSFKLNTINGGIGADSTGYARSGADKTLLNDYIVIKPSFRYVSKYGEVYDEDDIMLSCDAKGQHYVDLDNEMVTDTGATRSLTDIYFEGSLCAFPYNDDCSYGAKDNTVCGKYVNNIKMTTILTNYLPQAEKRTVQDIQNSKVPVHMSTHEFTIQPDNMLFHGDEAELESQLATNGADVDRYGSLFTGERNGNNRLYDLLTRDQKEAFMSSMQKWYGLYAIPNSIHVRVRRRTTDPEYNLYKDRNGKSFDDYTEYPWESMSSMLNTTGKIMTSDELRDIFANDGYLVLNFKITEYHNGQPEISYYECPSNMWDTEQNGGRPDDPNSPDNPSNPNGNPSITIKQDQPDNPNNPNPGQPVPDTVTIPIKDGDIAIIDLTQHKNSSGNHSEGEGQFTTDVLWVE